MYRELSTRQEAVEEAIATLRAERPEGALLDEIAAMLEAVLDMRQTLREANQDELIEVLDPLDVIATYTKSTRPPAGRDRHPALVADHEKATPTRSGR